ncbi:MAG: hypothetical protein Q9181_006957 [Wetmoreana brouardii]
MTIHDQTTSSSTSTLALPRLLCLHGGGTNAGIFYQQTRALRVQLQPYFRLCFADGPFICQSPGPDVTAVYGNLIPFRRWLRWLAMHPTVERKTAVEQIEAAIEAAMADDDAAGATGEWVGVLGFSQGATVAGSLLLRQQERVDEGAIEGGRLAAVRFRFGVLMAGSAPWVSLEPDSGVVLGLGDASQLSGTGGFPRDGRRRKQVLRLPTIHVHGLRDPRLEHHRQLMEQYCEVGSARLIEWDGNHRVPIKMTEAAAVVREILDVASEDWMPPH